MKESGQMERILRKWQPLARPDCWQTGKYCKMTLEDVDVISFVTCLILTASSCMCTGKFKSMGIENTLSAFMMISAAVVLAAIVFLMELMLRGTLLKPAKASRKYEMEDSVSERGDKFKREIRRRSSI